LPPQNAAAATRVKRSNVEKTPFYSGEQNSKWALPNELSRVDLMF
jgi:hypothetical protein